MPRQKKTEEPVSKPIFALRPPKRPALPRHTVAAKSETIQAMDAYIKWAAGELGIPYEEAQAQMLEVAVSDLIGKDQAYKAHQKAQAGTAKGDQD